MTDESRSEAAGQLGQLMASPDESLTLWKALITGISSPSIRAGLVLDPYCWSNVVKPFIFWDVSRALAGPEADLWVMCVLALLNDHRSGPRVVRPEMKAAGYGFAEQVAFEEATCPDAREVVAKARVVAEKVTELIRSSRPSFGMFLKRVKGAANCQNKALVVAYLCTDTPSAGLVVAYGGLPLLLQFGLSRQEEGDPEHVFVCAAVSRICMGIRTSLLPSEAAVQCANALLRMIEWKSSLTSKEMHDCLIGLINLTSDHNASILAQVEGLSTVFPAVWDVLVDSLSEESGQPDLMMVAAALEFMLNVAALGSEKVRDWLSSSERTKLISFLQHMPQSHMQGVGARIHRATSGILCVCKSSSHDSNVEKGLDSASEPCPIESCVSS